MTTTTNNIEGNAIVSQPGTGCWQVIWEGHRITINGRANCSISEVLTHLTWQLHPATVDQCHTALYDWYDQAGGIAYLERVRNTVEADEVETSGWQSQQAVIDGSDGDYLVAMLYEFAKFKPRNRLRQQVLDNSAGLWQALALARANYEHAQRLEGISVLRDELNPTTSIKSELDYTD